MNQDTPEAHIDGAASYMVKKMQSHVFTDEALDFAIVTFGLNIEPAFVANGFDESLAKLMAIEAVARVKKGLGR